MNARVPRQGMPVWLGPLHQRICRGVSRLPMAPPSALLAAALNRSLLGRLPADARGALSGHVVEIHVRDLGLRMRLQLGRAGFGAATRSGEPALRVAATVRSFLRLLRGTEDPDRLFFERELVMEGDTELGLVLKNTLDAIGAVGSL